MILAIISAAEDGIIAAWIASSYFTTHTCSDPRTTMIQLLTAYARNISQRHIDTYIGQRFERDRICSRECVEQLRRLKVCRLALSLWVPRVAERSCKVIWYFLFFRCLHCSVQRLEPLAFSGSSRQCILSTVQSPQALMLPVSHDPSSFWTTALKAGLNATLRDIAEL